MPAIRTKAALVFAAFLITSAVQSEDYDVTVEVDEATVSDAKLLGLYMKETPRGQAIPRSLQGLAIKLVGETEMALEAQKIDDTGLVVLDDGAAVALAVNDSLSALLQDPFDNGADVFVQFAQFETPSGEFHQRACAVSVCTPSGESIRVSIPPISVQRGPPGKATAKCKVRACKVKRGQ